jgi:hypothetical protein
LHFHAATNAAEHTAAFRTVDPEKGMKWAWSPARPVSTDGYRHISMRYRAGNIAKIEGGDFAVSLVGDSGYANVFAIRDLLADGRWHVVNVDLRETAATLKQFHTVAIQVQAVESEATFEISDIRLTNALQPARLDDAVAWQNGARFGAFVPIDLSAITHGLSDQWRDRLRLDRWFPQSDVTIAGVPMRLLNKPPDLAITTVAEQSELRLPINASASELFLLLGAEMTGEDEPAYGGGRLLAIHDVDRFRVRLEYADGSADECMPMNVETKRFQVVEGVQLLAIAIDSSKQLDTLVICDRAKQAAFAVAAVTIRRGQDRLLPEALEDSPPWKPISKGSPVSPWDYVPTPQSLVEIRVDGTTIAPARLEAVMTSRSNGKTVEYRVRDVDGLRIGLELTAGTDASQLNITAWARNTGTRQRTIDLTAPMVGPYRLGKCPDDAFYLFPRCGAVFDNRDCNFRTRYCGDFPLQFVDTFDSQAGRGLTLQTFDTTCIPKEYVLRKHAETYWVGTAYPKIALKPGERFQTPPMAIRTTDGDWHRGLEAYRQWLATWYRPKSPRKTWFREAFNFRQQFLANWRSLAKWESLWNWLYDGDDGTFHLERAIAEAKCHFGGIDFLHLNDWGTTPGRLRIYGRTGDDPPYDRFRGGGEAFRKAIADVQKQGVPVGLYIEGYLLDERGRLGQQAGHRWQMRDANGQGCYWPNSREMYACPAIPDWVEVQRSTYADRVRELNVDGMYIDQFGFAGRFRDCWAKDHGHVVPSHAVTVERDCTRTIRQGIEGIKKEGVLYTEETPVDVTTQEQDGSFTYAMFNSQRMPLRVPLNLTRFAIPDFKTFEILVCDKPTGSWATGVKWVFFNGEGIWLELPPERSFEPETLATIRRCYAILHKHRDAFTTLRPIPLVRTEMGGVYVNAFPAEKKTVYTFYNARHRTVRGEMLRIPGADKAAFFNEWNHQSAKVRRDGNDAVVWLEIGPQDVGCVVVKPTE